MTTRLNDEWAAAMGVRVAAIECDLVRLEAAMATIDDRLVEIVAIVRGVSMMVSAFPGGFVPATM